MKRRLVSDAAPTELGSILWPKFYKQVAPNGAFNSALCLAHRGVGSGRCSLSQQAAAFTRAARWGLKFVERLDQISRQRPDAIEDAGGERFRRHVTGGEHFQAGVEIVDVMERHRFGRFRADGRTELRLAVVGADQMQQMQTDIFGRRHQPLPRLGVFSGNF